MNSRIRQSFKLVQSEHPWREGLKAVGLGISLVFGIRVAAGQCYWIASGSMEPTLAVNDRLLVDKVSYRLTAPRRGEIVFFLPPQQANESRTSSITYVKRIIGLPGERVEIKGGKVYINNAPLLENYLADRPNYIWGPQTIPPNSYLVLGDNRNHSYDGHYWGFVPRDRLVGRAAIRFWPPQRWNGFVTDTTEEQRRNKV